MVSYLIWWGSVFSDDSSAHICTPASAFFEYGAWVITSCYIQDSVGYWAKDFKAFVSYKTSLWLIEATNIVLFDLKAPGSKKSAMASHLGRWYNHSDADGEKTSLTRIHSGLFALDFRHQSDNCRYIFESIALGTLSYYTAQIMLLCITAYICWSSSRRAYICVKLFAASLTLLRN